MPQEPKPTRRAGVTPEHEAIVKAVEKLEAAQSGEGIPPLAQEALATLREAMPPSGNTNSGARMVSLDEMEERLARRADALMLSNDWSLWHSGGGCFAMRRELPEPFDHALLTSLTDGANIPLNHHDKVILGIYNADDGKVREYQGEFELVLKTFRLAVLQPAVEQPKEI